VLHPKTTTTRGRACDEHAERGEGRRVASQDDETTRERACDERAEMRGEGCRVASQDDAWKSM
jgi:hypothetical protein